MKLTNKNIGAMSYQGVERTPGQWSRDIRWDDETPCFGIRIFPPTKKADQGEPTSRKSFVLFFRSKGQQHLMTLGRFGVLTAVQARKQAEARLAEVADGGNPLEARATQRQKQTFRELKNAYVEKHASTKKTGNADISRLNRHIPKRWLSRLAEDISGDDIADLHHKIGVEQGKPYEANRLLEILRAMFNLAPGPGWRHVPPGHLNPTTGIKKHPEKKRKVWVTREQMKPLVKAIQKEPNIYIRAALWTLILTGMRKGELLEAKRADIDWSRAMLKLPDPKAGEPQEVALNQQAVAILQALPVQEANPHLFPGRRKGRHIVNIDIAWGRIRKEAGVPDVRLHDLRRTVGSWLSQNKADLNVIKEALRHADINTTLTYARLGADPAREIMEEHGRQVIESAGAVTLVEGAADDG